MTYIQTHNEMAKKIQLVAWCLQLTGGESAVNFSFVFTSLNPQCVLGFQYRCDSPLHLSHAPKRDLHKQCATKHGWGQMVCIGSNIFCDSKTF